MTLYDDVYDAFLAKIGEDEWLEGLSDCVIQEDFRQILESAIPYFKFPRVSLARDSIGFTETLNSEEIQILATFMKAEWVERIVLDWENVKPLYHEKDWSPGNFLEKLISLSDKTERKARRLESTYYRSVSGRPCDYTKLSSNDR